jgi:hypothetical protein
VTGVLPLAAVGFRLKMFSVLDKGQKLLDLLLLFSFVTFNHKATSYF